MEKNKDLSLNPSSDNQYPAMINIGSGVDITIKSLAYLIRNIVGYKGVLKFDSMRPDGMPLKRLDVSKANNLGWKSNINLNEGLRLTYKWYLKQKEL